MNRIKSNIHFKNKHLVWGIGLLVFSLVLSTIWFKSFAETTPLPPLSLTYGTVTSSMVPLTWFDTATNEDKFNIERKLSASGAWASIDLLMGADVTSYNDTSVTAGNTYDYRVQACLTNFGCSSYSTVSNVMVPTSVAPTTPTAPSGLTTGAITSSLVPLVWTDNSDNEDSFKIERKLHTDATFAFLGSVGTDITFYDDSSVTAGSTYDYRIQACLSANCSGYFELDNIMVSTTIAPITPTAPSRLTTDAITSSKVPLKWTDNSDNEDNFKIERKLHTDATFAFLGSIGTDITSYDDSSVTAGSTYDYRIQACLSDDCSGYFELDGIKVLARQSSIVGGSSDGGSSATDSSANNPPIYIPVAPSNLSLDGIVIPKYISIQWKDNANNEDKFNIERKLSNTGTWSNIGQVGTNVIHYVDTKVALGTAYDYRVQACLSGVGCSDYITLEKVYTTVPIIPPTNLIPNTTIPLIDNPIIPIIPTTTLPTVTSPGVPIVPVVKAPKLIPEEIIPNIVDKQENTTNENIQFIPEDTMKTLNALLEINKENINNKELTNEEITELVNKDTNKDGVSDYDSKYIYNIDPIKPSVTSTYKGKKINAGDKILLGFDPAQKDIIEVVKEQPLESSSPIVNSYKVNEISLTTDKKEIVFKGQALPNSFVTVYIYSTPIMVTIKTDSKGEWQYVFDKELENGDHTIYVATVNNTGNIVAKSSPYTFTKTAEAVTLTDLPVAEASVAPFVKPDEISNKSIYTIIISLVAIIAVTLILIGLFTKKKEEIPNTPNT